MTRPQALQKIRDAKLYGIVDLGYISAENVGRVAEELIAGGAGVIQLRAKGFEKTEIQRLSAIVSQVCKASGTPFIVNDFADIAVAVAADGLHIGQDDGSLDAARAVVGPDMIIGRSTHSVDQARGARDEGFDYGGFGPLFPTPTKKGRPGIGLENIATVEREISTDMPLFCIGGITFQTLDEVIAAGAKRVVIVSQLLTADDITAATRSVVEKLS